MLSPEAPPALGQNRDFTAYWAGQVLSSLGDGFAALATPLLVLHATGSVAQMGAITAVTTAGRLLSALVAGLVVDRVDRRLLMIACDAARAVLWGLVPLWWWLAGPSMPLLFVVATLAALIGNVFYVACFSAVPALVRREDVVAANSRLHGSFAIMGLVGPMLSGLVCDRYGPVAGISINAVSFVASAASMVIVRMRPPDHDDSPPSVTEEDLRRDGRFASALAGARFLFRTPLLRLVALAVAAVSLLGSARTDLIVFHLQSDLHIGAGGTGVVMGLAALGAIVASLLAPKFHHRAGFRWTWLVAGVLAGAPLVAVSRLGATVPGMAALLLVTSAGEALRGIATQSLRHRITPDRILGRVTAAFWAVLDLPAAVGAVAMTALAASAGAVRTLQITALATLVVVLVAWVWLPRSEVDSGGASG